MPPDGIVLLKPVSVANVPKEEIAKYNYARPQTTKVEKLSGPVSEEKRKANFDLFAKMGIPSIASLKQKEEKLQEVNDSKAEVILQRKNPFDAPAFKAAWTAVCDRVREQGRDSFYVTMTKHEPEVDYSTFIIKLQIENKVQEQDIQREKPWILENLRDSLSNDSLNFEIVLSEGNTVVQPYTAREKFMKMAEKNKALIYLADKLKLDL
jgi:DNA polymerase-3 subunit gamma/tau